jgi:hypothetical protein
MPITTTVPIDNLAERIAQQQSALEGLADLALAWLKQAVAAGSKDAAHVHNSA